jgi:hypothetical protein
VKALLVVNVEIAHGREFAQLVEAIRSAVAARGLGQSTVTMTAHTGDAATKISEAIEAAARDAG